MSELVEELGALQRIWRALKASIVGAAPYQVVIPERRAAIAVEVMAPKSTDAAGDGTAVAIPAAVEQLDVAVAVPLSRTDTAAVPASSAARFQLSARLASVATLNQPKARAGISRTAPASAAVPRPLRRTAAASQAAKKKVAKRYVRLVKAQTTAVTPVAAASAPAKAHQTVPTSNVWPRLPEATHEGSARLLPCPTAAMARALITHDESAHMNSFRP